MYVYLDEAYFFNRITNSFKIAFQKIFFSFRRKKTSLMYLQGVHMQQVQQILYCYYCAVEKNNAKSMG